MTRRLLAVQFASGCGWGALAGVAVLLVEPGWGGIYLIAAIAVTVGVIVNGGLEARQRPDERLRPWALAIRRHLRRR